MNVRRTAGIATLAATFALAAAGCSATPPTPPTPAPATEVARCEGLNFAAWDTCWDRAHAEDEATRQANREAEIAYNHELGEWTAQPPALRRLHATAAWWGAHPGLWVALGLALLSSAAAGASSDEEAMKKLPSHRDPRGPAAGLLRTAAARQRALGWGGVAIAAPVAGYSLGPDLGPLAIGLVIGVLALWGIVARRRHLGVAHAGYAIADARWAEAVADAERDGQPWPPEPQLTVAEAAGLGETRGFQVPEGSAAATMLAIDGSDRPTRQAWSAVSQALGMGRTDEGGGFTAWAQIEGALLHDGGDVTVVWRVDDPAKTAASMAPAAGPLLRQLRVRELVGGAFTTRLEDGRIVGRFSNGGQPQAASNAAPTDDEWDF